MTQTPTAANSISAQPGQMRSLPASAELFNRAKNVLAGGVSSSARLGERPTPMFVHRAEGSKLWDQDGNCFIDYFCGMGPIVLGHGYAPVAAAVAEAAANLQQTGAQTEADVLLAERLCEVVPSFELVRFSVTGSEAVHTAVRLARAATGRNLIIKFAGHYHGWYDGICTGVTSGTGGPESAGQLESAVSDVVVARWNELDELRELLQELSGQVAGVIMEPLSCNGGTIFPKDGYLAGARELTEKAGAVLIFDEVITGFRMGLGGFQKLVGVTPDLTVSAKAMANGFPISVVGGRAEIMAGITRNEVRHQGTYAAGGLSIAASLATLEALSANDEEAVTSMTRNGQRLMEGLTRAARRNGVPLIAQGPGPLFHTWLTPNDAVNSFEDHLSTDFPRYRWFAEQMLLHGIRIQASGRWYMSAAHTTDDVDVTLRTAEALFEAWPD